MTEPIDIAVDLGAVPQPLPDLVWLKDSPPMDTNLSPQRRGGAESESSFDRIVGQRFGSNFQKCVGGKAANKGIRGSSHLQQARHRRACLYAIIGQPEYSGILKKNRRTGQIGRAHV